MRTILSTAAVAAVAAAAVIAPAGAASADSAVINDAVSDTWENIYDFETGTSSWKSTDSVANVDLDKVTVVHGDKRVTLKAKYQSLKKNQTSFYYHGVIKRDVGKPWILGGDAMPTEDGWQVSGFAMKHEAQSGRRGEVGSAPDCEGVKAHVDFADDLFTVSMPRSCMGGPRWVKAHVTSGGYSYANEEFHSWFDNAHVKGHDEDRGWTDQIKKG